MNIAKCNEMPLPEANPTPRNGQAVRDLGTLSAADERERHAQEYAALQQEQPLLRTLIDNLPDYVYIKSAEGRFVLANVAVARQMGFSSPDEIIGKSDFDLFPQELAARYRAEEVEMIRSGKGLYNHEGPTVDASKEEENRWVSTTKVILRNAQGEVTGFIGLGRDITEQKRAQDALRSSEAKLRQSTVQLERSNRELQDFAYVASHGLQEPLRKIVVFGERLKEQNAATMAQTSLDHLDRMQKAAGRMQVLINDLLSFSRVTSKAQPFTPVNLAEVASGVVEDLEGRIELVKGRVEVSALPVIDAEPLQMRQLLQNLIGNALKFRRPEEPPVVKVDAQIIPDPVTSDKKLCRLTISDNCIGFDEKYLDRIFNVFQRLHTRNEYEGTGMGLAIVRKIALHHGGDVTAKSKLGEGATFIVTLPVTHPKEPHAPGEGPEKEK